MTDCATPTRLFHGTVVADLEQVLPAWETGAAVSFPHDTNPAYAYATPDEDTAWAYAEKAWHCHDRGIPRVYVVAPLGELEVDPSTDGHGQLRGNYSSDLRSRDGFAVVCELPMPERLGEPDEWR